MSAGWGIQIEKDGKKQSLYAWHRDTGLSYKTLRERYEQGMSVDEILRVVRSRGARKPRSAHDPIAARAYGQLKNARENSSSPWAGLWACIVLQAVMDWFDDDRRAEVEEFFRGPWYASMSGGSGDHIVQLLRKEGAHGRRKTVYAGGSYNRAV